MKSLLIALLLGVTLVSARAEDTLQTDMQALVTKIQTQLEAGKRTEADLAAELKEFDALIAKHSKEAPDALAQVQFMKAMLYLQVFHEPARGVAILEQIKKEYPDSQIAGKVDTLVASLKQQEAAQKLNESLAVGAVFPPFEVKDLDGKSLSLTSQKGKVTLVDFWATWCPPCVAELPAVLAVYKKYHDKGFNIVGISLDKDKDVLLGFLKENEMTWPQYFDGLGWGNTLAKQYGINSIPATYLVGADGKILATDLRGPALEKAVAAAIGE